MKKYTDTEFALFSQLKEEQKELALEIRTLKSKRKGSPNGVVPGLWMASYHYRNRHIAYCLLKGTSYERIEGNCDDGPGWSEVDHVMKGICPGLAQEIIDAR